MRRHPGHDRSHRLPGAFVAARVGRLRRQLHHRSEVLLFSRVVAVAAVVPLFVRLPLPRQATLLAPRKKRVPARTADIELVARCVDLAQDVARPLVRRGCLTHAITLYWFLGRDDADIELCFGLGHPDGGEDFSGHCWLARGGQPFLERADPTELFGVVYRIPVAAS